MNTSLLLDAVSGTWRTDVRLVNSPSFGHLGTRKPEQLEVYVGCIEGQLPYPFRWELAIGDDCVLKLLENKTEAKVGTIASRQAQILGSAQDKG